MTLSHNECGGKVMTDLMYKSESFIDLYCLICGKRWHVPRSNSLAKLLVS